MSFPTLETKRLYLIELNERHASALFSILSNDDVILHYGMEKMIRINEALSLIALLRSNFIDGRGIRWGIVRKADGQLIGTSGLNSFSAKISEQKSVMKSILVIGGRDTHPRRFAKFLTIALAEWGFRELALSFIPKTSLLLRFFQNSALSMKAYCAIICIKATPHTIRMFTRY